MSKTLRPEEGEQILLNLNHPVVFVCCDCGLAHKHEYDLPTKKGFMRAKIYRDNRTTAAYRRHREHDFIAKEDAKMPAISIHQQAAAGKALAAKRGKLKASELFGSAKSMFKSMTEKQLHDFASTPIKGLPERVKRKGR